MATINARTRTNTFTVCDLDAFKADLTKYGIPYLHGADARISEGALLIRSMGPDNRIALFSYETMPSLEPYAIADRVDLDVDDPRLPSGHGDFAALVAAHLQSDQVAIFIEVGWENMRYFFAQSIAVNAAGDCRVVDIDSIYDLAAKELAPAGAILTRAIS